MGKPTSTILVIGGAGYIGSQMAKLLSRSGYKVVVLDNLSTGRRSSVRYGDFVQGNLGDRAVLDEILKGSRVSAVMHFAAFSLVEESMREPAKYYRNNVARTLTLLEEMLRHDVRTFIFSSSAAVYGEPSYVPIDEAHPLAPMNPYGASKLMVERMLADLSESAGLRSVSLRYFNAAGADPEGELGECHDPETHLIPNVLQAASGRKAAFTLYGVDYPTPDGTCVRDYIHVSDLCRAHLLALEYLMAGGKSTVCNLGNGEGFSILQVLGAVRKVTNRQFEVRKGARRPGDPARLVADASMARRLLNWEPEFGLEEIVRDAWVWEKKPVK